MKAHQEAANDPEPEPPQTEPEPNPFPQTSKPAPLQPYLWKDRYRKVAEEVADQHGFPHEKLNISDETPTMELNGETQKVSGHYFPGEDKINLYHQHIWDDEHVRDVLTHEIGHHRFNYVNEHHDPDSKAAWAYIVRNQNQLAKDDGVTGYSRDWWKASNAGTATPHQAINETLAELMMMGTRGQRRHDKIQQNLKTINPLNPKVKFNVLHHFAGVGVKPSWIKTFELYQKAYLKNRIKELKENASNQRDIQRPTSPDGPTP